MNLTTDELVALAHFMHAFMKEAMDRMPAEEMQHIDSALLKLLAYTQTARERRLQEVEGFYDPL